MKKILFPLLLLLFSCIPELIPPVVEIIYPPENSEYEKGEIINVRVNATDEDGVIAELRFFVDDFGMASTADFPYTFTIATDNMPLGAHIMKVVATDDDGKEAEDTQTFTIVSALVAVQTEQPSIITRDSAVLEGSILNNGGSDVGKVGFVWGTEANNTPSYIEVDAQLVENRFSYTLTDLTAETIYVVAFAENEKGRSYGEVISFNTIPPENQPPVVTIISPIKDQEFTVGEDMYINLLISDDEDDIARVRIFFDFQGIAELGGFPYTYTHTITGTDAGPTPLRIEVTDGQGAITEITRFHTINPNLSEVETHEAHSITEVGAIAGGSIIDDGGGTILAAGIIWGSEPYNGSNFQDQPATVADDQFSVNLESLEFGTYYYIAYAENEAGRSFGEEVSFQTLLPNNMFVDERDGKAYEWVNIGPQVWMAENLAWLPEMNNSNNSSPTEPFHYVYGYSGFNVDEAMAHPNYEAYGVLYNYPAAEEGCPAGWHLPTQEEVRTLVANIGGSTQSGRLIEEGNEHWSNNNSASTNTTGFSARGAGRATANQNGVIRFDNLRTRTGYWMSDPCSWGEENGMPFTLIQGTPFVIQDDQCSYYQNGNSVRCVKD